MAITNLGEIAGAVLKIIDKHHKEDGEMNDDLHAFGAPSECWDLAFSGRDSEKLQEIVACVHSYKVSFNIFKDELRERCDGRWMHVTGLDEVFYSD